MRPAEKRYTETEYLARERARDGRCEYVDGVEHAMSGASGAHNDLVLALGSMLRDALAPRGCRARVADQRLKVGTRFYYPDVVAFCGEPSYLDDAFDTLTDARLVIEVLSPTTEKTDRDEKFDAYEHLGSLRDYALVDSRQVRIEHHHRDAITDPWVRHVARAGGTLAIPALDVRLPVDAIYDRVQLDPLVRTPEPS